MFTILILIFIFFPISAEAIQLHTYPEGLYSHQFAHAFFAFSMLVLIYVIKKKKIDYNKGWNFLIYSAWCFIIWNLVAMTGHYLAAKDIFFINNSGKINAVLISKDKHEFETIIYYISKLDHIFLIPGFIFLYLAFNKFLKEN